MAVKFDNISNGQILNCKGIMKTKLKIKKYIEDVSLPYEERYKQLEKHHLEETAELIKIIEALEKEIYIYLPFDHPLVYNRKLG